MQLHGHRLFILELEPQVDKGFRPTPRGRFEKYLCACSMVCDSEAVCCHEIRTPFENLKDYYLTVIVAHPII